MGLRLSVSVMVFFLLMGSFPAFGDFLYQKYIVRQDRGIEILCDPYIVQRNDWVFKVFKQKGEISSEDYSEFLQIFKRINPYINNPDIIRPGQHILIPLKKLAPGDLPGQSEGIVTIPFVANLDADEILSKNTVKYKVKKGDCVSNMVSQRFGECGTPLYSQGIKIFKYMNPDIKNLDTIYVGNYINLPDPSIQNQPWYQSLFDNSGNITGDADQTKHTADSTPDSLLPETTNETTKNNQLFCSPLSEAASVLGAKLMDKGTYYFPTKKNNDLVLDLSLYPIIDLEWGGKIVCSFNETLSEEIKDAIKFNWEGARFISLSDDDSSQAIINSVFAATRKHQIQDPISFSDNGITATIKANWVIDKPFKEDETTHKICIFLIENSSEKTHPSICHYLALHNIIVKDHLIKKSIHENPQVDEVPMTHVDNDIAPINTDNNKTFVKDFVSALAFDYIEDVHVSFLYAGMQLQSTLNQISTQTGTSLLVDFGNIYGDAIQAVKNTGFNIIQIQNNDDYHSIIIKLLTALNLSFTPDPSLLVANRPETSNISLTIPGLLTEINKTKILVSHVTLPDDVINFIKDQGIKLITVIQKPITPPA
jgi:hypothetical protein